MTKIKRENRREIRCRRYWFCKRLGTLNLWESIRLFSPGGGRDGVPNGSKSNQGARSDGGIFDHQPSASRILLVKPIKSPKKRVFLNLVSSQREDKSEQPSIDTSLTSHWYLRSELRPTMDFQSGGRPPFSLQLLTYSTRPVIVHSTNGHF